MDKDYDRSAQGRGEAMSSKPLPNFAFTCPSCKTTIPVVWDLKGKKGGDVPFVLDCPTCKWHGTLHSGDGHPISLKP
jgi:hypothetical protein